VTEISPHRLNSLSRVQKVLEHQIFHTHNPTLRGCKSIAMASPKPTSRQDIPLFTLRPARVADAPAMAEIHISARDSAPGMPPSIHSPADIHAWMARALASGDAALVAERNGTVVGYAHYPGSNELADLYVLPSNQGRGVGAALLEAVKEARPGGFELWVFEANVEARRFYEKRGLVEVERTDGRGNEEGVPDVKMRWEGEKWL